MIQCRRYGEFLAIVGSPDDDPRIGACDDDLAVVFDQ